MAIRKAFVMKLKAGCEEEYRRRHSPLWPELEAVFRDHGVRNYTIFLLRETRQLFACAEIDDESRWAAIAETDVCRRWWRHMRELVEMDGAGRPEAMELSEAYHFPAV